MDADTFANADATPVEIPGVVTSAPLTGVESMFSHRPVMLDETLAGLTVRSDGLYLDATYGRGGHSAAIRQGLDTGRLWVLDQDPQAIADARDRFANDPNVTIVHANFGELSRIGEQHALNGRVSGLLMDLGVSSPQFDDGERGFSFSKDGPLDMRMNPDAGEPVSAWLARAAEDEIARVLYVYGEERASRRIARRIVASREQQPLLRTLQLAELIARALPGPRQRIHPATRSFQALRIFINRELEVLEQALQAARALLMPGGRLAVISFHSLEDRIVKQFVKSAADAGREDDLPPALRRVRDDAGPRLKAVARVFPSDAECADNPRARSAVLRIAERVA